MFDQLRMSINYKDEFHLYLDLNFTRYENVTIVTASIRNPHTYRTRVFTESGISRCMEGDVLSARLGDRLAVKNMCEHMWPYFSEIVPGIYSLFRKFQHDNPQTYMNDASDPAVAQQVQDLIKRANDFFAGKVDIETGEPVLVQETSGLSEDPVNNPQ